MKYTTNDFIAELKKISKKKVNSEKTINMPLTISEMNVIWQAMSGYRAGSGSAWVRDKIQSGFDYDGLLKKFFKYI